ncbi:hypothetical protein CRG98_003258, partial [Punica granatum]
MEVKVVQRPQISMWIEMDKIGRKPSGSLRFDPHRARGQQRVQVLISARLQPARVSNKQRASALEASYNSYKNFPASILESESINGPYDESVILK